MTEIMTAAAILTIVSTDNGGLTDIGNSIMQILNETRSMEALYRFFKRNKHFEQYEAIERNQTHYRYQIPIEEWTAVTGLVPEWFFRVTLDDGSLFYDRFFDADYKEYDESNRYIYLSLNDKLSSDIKKEIIALLNSTHSAKRLIEYFRENNLFDEYAEMNSNSRYCIPSIVWELYTDIAIEIVDVLPYTTDGLLFTMVDRSSYDLSCRHVILYIHN